MPPMSGPINTPFYAELWLVGESHMLVPISHARLGAVLSQPFPPPPITLPPKTHKTTTITETPHNQTQSWSTFGPWDQPRWEGSPFPSLVHITERSFVPGPNQSPGVFCKKSRYSELKRPDELKRPAWASTLNLLSILFTATLRGKYLHLQVLVWRSLQAIL